MRRTAQKQQPPAGDSPNQLAPAQWNVPRPSRGGHPGCAGARRHRQPRRSPRRRVLRTRSVHADRRGPRSRRRPRPGACRRVALTGWGGRALRAGGLCRRRRNVPRVVRCPGRACCTGTPGLSRVRNLDRRPRVAQSTSRRAAVPGHAQEGLTVPKDKIDVHAHYIPEVYRDSLVREVESPPDGIPALPEWNEGLAIAAMEKLDVRLAILSISSPGVHFGDATGAVALARAVNETGAQITRARPTRFGFFAVLPLPEVDDAVSETRYALDHLGADGISLLTNHRGMYLGDERLAPIFAEVAAHDSVIFIHPASPPHPPR